jgi:hypothetical protein
MAVRLSALSTATLYSVETFLFLPLVLTFSSFDNYLGSWARDTRKKEWTSFTWDFNQIWNMWATVEKVRGFSLVTFVANTPTNGKQTNKQTGLLAGNFLALWTTELRPKLPACSASLLVSSCSLIKFREGLFDRETFYLLGPQHFNGMRTRTRI